MLAKKYLSQQPALANYNYIDVANGLGYVSFYAATTKTSAGSDQLLIPNVLFSNDISTNVTPAAGPKQGLDYDWDASPFTTPRTIKGVAYISVTWSGSASGGSENGYMVFKIRKWDGTTETEIASVQSETKRNDIGSPWDKTSLLPVTIPQTQFKVGETLRITHEFWEDGQAAGTGSWDFWHDPKDRSTTATRYTTILRFDVPFLLDL